MTEPTTADIQERHDIDAKYKDQRGYCVAEAHIDRGILLDRLEKAEQTLEELERKLARAEAHRAAAGASLDSVLKQKSGYLSRIKQLEAIIGSKS